MTTQRQERDGSVVVTASATLSELLRGENGKAPLRKGKWTTEEEEYASHLVAAFTGGLLRLPDGTTLRAFLADELHCDPMRITKKFTGGACIGKRVYHSVETLATNRQIEQAQRDLDALGARFAGRLERARSRGSGGGSSFDLSRLQAPGIVSTPAMDSMAAKCAPPPRRQPSPTSAAPVPRQNSSDTPQQQQPRKRSVLAAARPACTGQKPHQYTAIKPAVPAPEQSPPSPPAAGSRFASVPVPAAAHARGDRSGDDRMPQPCEPSFRATLPAPVAYGGRHSHHQQAEQQQHGYGGYGGGFMAPGAYVYAPSAGGYYAGAGALEYLPSQLPLVPWAPAVQAHAGSSGGYYPHPAASLAPAPAPLQLPSPRAGIASGSPRSAASPPSSEDQEAGELLCGFIDHVKRSSSQADLRDFHATARRVSLEAQARQTAKNATATANLKASNSGCSTSTGTADATLIVSSYSGGSCGGSGCELSDGGSLSDATTEESLGSARSAPSLTGGKRRRGSSGSNGAAASGCSLKDVAAAVVGAETAAAAAAAWQLGKRARTDSGSGVSECGSSFAYVEADAA